MAIDDLNPADKRSAELLDLGTGIAGSVGGGVVGSLVAGPLGAVIGGVAGPMLTDFSRRVLSRKEKERTGAFFRYFAQKVDANVSAGKTVSPIFERTNDGRDAEQLLEQVLVTVQREYDEKKVAYYANLMGNIAFAESVDKFDAGLLLRVGANLSYRQLCILSVLDDDTQRAQLRQESLGEGPHSRSTVSAVQEMFELDRMGLINSGEFYAGMSNMVPGRMKVEATGRSLVDLMELKSIPSDDRRIVIESLK